MTQRSKQQLAARVKPGGDADEQNVIIFMLDLFVVTLSHVCMYQVQCRLTESTLKSCGIIQLGHCQFDALYSKCKEHTVTHIKCEDQRVMHNKCEDHTEKHVFTA